LKIEELETLVAKQILRYVEGVGYEFVNSKFLQELTEFLRYSCLMPMYCNFNSDWSQEILWQSSIECQELKLISRRFIKEIYRKKKFKPLTAQDYARLQGFPDGSRLRIIVLRQSINLVFAVSVPVVYYLAEALLKGHL
jgi:DNA (cytosine-5)-methyltransferase 1